MSKKKKNANKRKAKKGRMRAGNVDSNFNALKHGGNSPRLLPSENPVDYAAFRQKVWQEWQPANGLEEILVDEIAFDGWRLLRLARYEISLTDDPPEGMDRAMWADEFRKLTNMRIRIERVRDKKRDELKDLQMERMRATPLEMTVQEYRQHLINRNLIRPVVKYTGAFDHLLFGDMDADTLLPEDPTTSEPMEEPGRNGPDEPTDRTF